MVEQKNNWDNRYDEQRYFYGTEPNYFVERSLAGLAPGRALFLAEGEGRNAVYAAGLGHEVVAVDNSFVGRRKALELATRRVVEEDLRAMLEGNQLPTARQDALKIDGRLHAYLIEKAQNPYITDFFARHGKYYEAVFDWEALDRAAALQAVEQHREILTALIARDWEAAGDRLEHHIRHNHPVLKQLVTVASP